MSFGFEVGDLTAILKLVNEIREPFSDAPVDLKPISTSEFLYSEPDAVSS